MGVAFHLVPLDEIEDETWSAVNRICGCGGTEHAVVAPPLYSGRYLNLPLNSCTTIVTQMHIPVFLRFTQNATLLINNNMRVLGLSCQPSQVRHRIRRAEEAPSVHSFPALGSSDSDLIAVELASHAHNQPLDLNCFANKCYV